MAIYAECEECGQGHKVSETKAGSRFRCSNCREVVDVPFPDQRSSSRKGSSSRRSKSKRKSSGDSNLVPMAIAVGGVLFLAVVAFAAFRFVQGMAPAQQQLAEGEQENGPTPERSSVQPTAASGEYKLTLERQRELKSERDREELVRQFGADKVVTVRFKNVTGETNPAYRYLQRKVFRAAYKDYADGASRAQQETEANRKAAAEEAVENAKGSVFGGVVMYQYRQVRSDVPYPRVAGGHHEGNTMTFHAGPAANPDEFIQRIGLGQSSNSNGREVEITVNLPSPVPDPDVEDLVVEYGANQVLTVTVAEANGDPKAIKMYLEDETKELAADQKFSLVAYKELGAGACEFTVGPIPNFQAFADRLTWGQVVNLDEANHRLSMRATLPVDLPSYEEMVAVKTAKRKDDDAIRVADRERRPRPNESELDWAIRVIKEKSVFVTEKAAKSLATMKVDEDRREEVAKVLADTVESQHSHFEAYIDAMLHWRTEETERIILRMGGTNGAVNGNRRSGLMRALVELGTDDCAKALASGLPDFFAGKDCVPYLVQMGPIAEDHVIFYLKHQDARTRERVYAVLSDIGTSKSLSKIRSNIKLETNPQMKATAEACMETIQERVNEQKKPE